MSSVPSVHPLAALDAVRARAAGGARLRPSTVGSPGSLAVDAVMLLAAVAATVLGSRGSGMPVLATAWLGGFCALVLVLAWVRGMYRPRLKLDLLDDLRSLVAVTSLAAMATLSVYVVFTDAAVSGAEVVRPWAFATAYLAAGRAALYWSQVAARRE